jgi:hypothetical protein
MPSCPKSGGLVTFTPGLYTSASALSACDRSNITMWFTPGTYYFSFPSTTASSAVWQMDNATLVGGTPTQSLATQVPTMPGSCVSPLATTTPDTGVQFVFGGESRVVLGGKAHIELCGSYSISTPPVVVTGLTATVKAVPAGSGCVTAAGGCALISSTSSPQDTSALYLQGTVYAPAAMVALSAVTQGKHQTTMSIADGIVARRVTALVDGASPTVGVAALTPDPPPTRQTASIVWLQVFVCADVSPCSTDQKGAAAGRLQLSARVGISQPSTGKVVAGARAVTVYSWAVQR